MDGADEQPAPGVDESAAAAVAEEIGEDIDPSLIALIDAVILAGRRLATYEFDTPEVTPIAPQEQMVLRHVHRHPGATPSQLAHHLVLRSSNTSTAIRGLEQKGLLTRIPDDADRRTVRLHVTDHARRGISRVHREWHAVLTEAGLGQEDLGSAAHAVDRLARALEQAPR